ncbi:MAG TPA: IclR family transcriptional regulator [Devosia sp.]
MTETTAKAGFADAAMKHRIPVIDRMMDVLAQLERREAGATIRDLVTALRLPRTTIYRILNTLQLHDMVHRDEGGAYSLGSRLLTLASHVAIGAGQVDLAAVAQPIMDRLAAEIGEACKLTVIDKDGTLVLATATARREYALSVTPGQRLAAHAGAAGKLLLAYMPDADRKEWLSRPLAAFTAKTFSDPRRLASELTRIRRLGWSQDRGEGMASVHAFAAPIFDSRNQVVAALSIPFLAGAEPSRMEDIRLAAIATAKDVSAAIPGPVNR